jgi:hypothetical protein
MSRFVMNVRIDGSVVVIDGKTNKVVAGPCCWDAANEYAFKANMGLLNPVSPPCNCQCASMEMETMKYDLVKIIQRQIAWSHKALGPAKNPNRLIDHIRRELVELESTPDDLDEWIDIIILGLDGAWRLDVSPQEICEALIAKIAKNEQRKWPDWRTADPNKAIEHIREDEDA